MKRVLNISLVLMLALPLVADEAKKPETKKSSEAKAAPQKAAPQNAAPQNAAPLQSVHQAPATGDSPLVQAAKRSNRLGRKPVAAVITNETLSKSKGHITTTASQAPIVVPPKAEPTAMEKAEAAKKEADAKRQAQLELAARKKAEEEKKKQERAERMYEEGYDGGHDDADAFAGQAPPPPR